MFARGKGGNGLSLRSRRQKLKTKAAASLRAGRRENRPSAPFSAKEAKERTSHEKISKPKLHSALKASSNKQKKRQIIEPKLSRAGRR